MRQLKANSSELLTLLLIFIALCPILIFRDFTPDNELKYLSIADEALEDGNLFAFYYQGTVYADKPPLYLWLIMGAKTLFGRHINFIIYLFSVIPALVTAFVMNRFSSRLRFSATTATTMMFTSAFFLAAAVVARMDMLMTMFIVLSIYSFYRAYELRTAQSSSQTGAISNTGIDKWRWLFAIFLFLALFTKGPLGLMIPLISPLAFLLWEKKLKKCWNLCFGWRTWLVLILSSSLWFFLVWTEGGSEYLNNLLFHQTVDRAVDAFYHKEPFWYYFARFWYMTAPLSLFIAATVINGWLRPHTTTSLEKLYLTVFIVTIAMLSMISSKLEIYLLPALPFIIHLAAIEKPFIQKECILRWCIALPAVIFLFVLPAVVYYVTCMDQQYDKTMLLVIGSILSLGGLISLITLNNTNRSIKSLGATLLFAAFVTGFFMTGELNSYIGGYNVCKKAYELAHDESFCQAGDMPDIANSKTICFYNFRAGKNFDTFFKQMLIDSGADKDSVKNFTMRELDENGLKSAKNIVFIFKSKDLKKDEVLAETVSTLAAYNFGTYTVCLKGEL